MLVDDSIEAISASRDSLVSCGGKDRAIPSDFHAVSSSDSAPSTTVDSLPEPRIRVNPTSSEL